MSTLKYTNGARGLVGSSYTAGASTITLHSGDGALFPTTGDFWVAVYDPPQFYLRCTARSSDVLTVDTSGADGTTAVNAAVGIAVTEVLCKAALDQLKADVLAAAVVTTGSIIASLYVNTVQSTNSTTYVSLATPDSVTFTLAATTIVVIRYMATVFNTSTGNTPWQKVYADGVGVGNDVSAVASQGQVSVPFAITHSMSLAAGSHTIEVKHRVDGGPGFQWWSRLLEIMAVG